MPPMPRGFGVVPEWERPWSVCSPRAAPARPSRNQDPGPVRPGSAGAGGAPRAGSGGRSGGSAHIVCSVPPQHMFGLETSVMLPLVAACRWLTGRPLLPADVTALRRCGSARPGSRRPCTCARSPVRRGPAQLPRRDGVDHAACPGAGRPGGEPRRARRCSRSTAPRKPAWSPCGAARSTRWRPVGGVRIESAEGGHPRLGRPFPIAADSGRPDRVGRARRSSARPAAGLDQDRGRRASLAGLNLLLQDLPGLTDGVFYLPPPARPPNAWY